jgi:peptidoglycan/LPS O-acetylase OafA/YrhL
MRNHQFDLLRILFATLVLLSHAPEITDGNRSRELLHRLTGAPVSFGTLGVDGFFCAERLSDRTKLLPQRFVSLRAG